MAEMELYERLAEHLDQGIVGAPKSASLLEILKILFPGEEARVALLLPMRNVSLSELKGVFQDIPNVEEILNRMASRGTVYTSQRPGEERKYRLLPSVVGWAETPFWAGRDTPEVRRLAPLWLKYREEAFAKELARGVPVVRVIPVSKSIEQDRQVLPFDALRELVSATSHRAVAHCPCRQIKRFVGDGCDHSTENCLHFGSMARYMVEHGMAREISVDETMEILRAAHEEGLVHVADNMQGHLATICNCCGCCCAFLSTMKGMRLQTISPSNYVSRVDEEACVGCGTCEDRCPMDAIHVDDTGHARVEESICIGCGVCTPSCPNDAVELVLRGQPKGPPRLDELLSARLKAAFDPQPPSPKGKPL